jgi:hypothetical protein
MSLRIKSVSDGYGPSVSVGVTAHAALVPVVVVGVEVDVGLVGELPHPNATAALAAAPMAPMSSRRLIFLLCIRHFLATFRPAATDSRRRRLVILAVAGSDASE